MFMHSSSSLENNTRFQTKMGKVIARFSDQNGAKTLAFGAAHTVMACIMSTPGLDPKSENYAALEHGFPLVAFKFHTAKRQSLR